MANYPFLSREPRSGRIVYRRRVPDKLRSVLGRHEFKKSFGKGALSDILPAYHAFAADIEKQFQSAAAGDKPQDTTCRAGKPSKQKSHLQPPDRDCPDTDPYTAELANITKVHRERCLADERRNRDRLKAEARENPLRLRSGELFKSVYSWTDPMAQIVQVEYLCPDENGRTLLDRPECSGIKTAHYDSQTNKFIQVSRDLDYIRVSDDDIFDRAWQDKLFRRMTRLICAIVTDDFSEMQTVCMRRAPGLNGLGPDYVKAIAQGEFEALKILRNESIDAMNASQEKVSTSTLTKEIANQEQTSVPLLSLCVAEWCNERSIEKKSISQERLNLCKLVMNDFMSVAGDKPVNSYTKTDGRRFKQILVRLPSNLAKYPKLASIRHNLSQVAEEAAKMGLNPQDIGTVKKKIGIARQCFRWITENYDECTLNPIPELYNAQAGRANEKVRPFTAEHLHKIFNAPPFTGCRSSHFWQQTGDIILRDEAIYWVPLIAYYTGMRSNEICQLRQDYVREYDGVHYFWLNEGYWVTDGQVMLKNEPSTRNVPIHRDLLSFGFLDFVARQNDRLFPEIPKHTSGRYSDSFGKRFSRLLKAIEIKSRGINLHSFRHTFEDMARLSPAEDRHIRRIVGRVLQGESNRYGSDFSLEQQDMKLLKVRNEQLHSINFGGVDLSHLKI